MTTGMGSAWRRLLDGWMHDTTTRALPRWSVSSLSGLRWFLNFCLLVRLPRSVDRGPSVTSPREPGMSSTVGVVEGNPLYRAWLMHYQIPHSTCRAKDRSWGRGDAQCAGALPCLGLDAPGNLVLVPPSWNLLDDRWNRNLYLIGCRNIPRLGIHQQLLSQTHVCASHGTRGCCALVLNRLLSPWQPASLSFMIQHRHGGRPSEGPR